MKTDAALPDLTAALSGGNRQLVSKQKWLKLWEENNRIITAQAYRPAAAAPQSPGGGETAAGNASTAAAARQEGTNSVNLLQLALQQGGVPPAAAHGPVTTRPPQGLQQLTLTVVEHPRRPLPQFAAPPATTRAVRAALRQLERPAAGISNLPVNISAGEVQLWLRDYRKGFLSRLDALLGDIKTLLQHHGLKLTGVKINGEIYRRY